MIYSNCSGLTVKVVSCFIIRITPLIPVDLNNQRLGFAEFSIGAHVKRMICQHGITPKRNCKICNTERALRAYYSDKENKRASKKKWEENNPEYRITWQRNNKKKIAGYSSKWQTSNPEKVNEIIREWRRRNPEKCAEYQNNRRSRKLGNGGKFTSSEWIAVKNKFSNTCLCCDLKEPDIKLTPDHVIPLAKGGSNSIDNIQPLCKRCNSKKGVKIIDYRRIYNEK